MPTRACAVFTGPNRSRGSARDVPELASGSVWTAETESPIHYHALRTDMWRRLLLANAHGQSAGSVHYGQQRETSLILVIGSNEQKCGLYQRSDSIVTNYVSSIIMNKTNTLLHSRFRKNRSYAKSLLTRSLSIRFIQSNSQNVNKATSDCRLCPGYAI